MVKAEMGTQVCQPVRVLHVLGRLNMGGAESRIMDLYRHIDRSKVQFDFLVHTEARPADGETTSEALMAARRPDDFEAEIRSLGEEYMRSRGSTEEILAPTAGRRRLSSRRITTGFWWRDT